jgi:nucleoid DNA-binding protein
MDKPMSMSVKDYLIRKLSVSLMMSEKTIEAIVNHQFRSANVALQDNNTVEISGLGKFYFNYKKAVRKMEKMVSKANLFHAQVNNMELTEQKRQSSANKLANTLAQIETLKPKLNVEHQPDLRGMEKQVDSSSTLEGTNQAY